MKVFISQPMRDKTDNEIIEERNHLISLVKEMYPDEEIQVIDSLFKDAPHEAKPLWYLGESIKLLSDADIAIFAKGWEVARGCFIEYKCCLYYGIEIVEI